MVIIIDKSGYLVDAKLARRSPSMLGMVTPVTHDMADAQFERAEAEALMQQIHH